MPALTNSLFVLSFFVYMKIERNKNGAAGNNVANSMLPSVSPAGFPKKIADGIHMQSRGLAGTRIQEMTSGFVLGSVIFVIHPVKNKSKSPSSSIRHRGILQTNPQPGARKLFQNMPR